MLVLISIILVALLKSTGDYIDSAIWTTAEPCMGVISACIPSVRPLFSLRMSGPTKGLEVSKLRRDSALNRSRGSSRMAWRIRADHDEEERFPRSQEPTDNRMKWGYDVSAKGGKTTEREGKMTSV